jgi:uncharacterized protein (DUF1800 family)
VITRDTAIAANRFGLGARPGELRAIGADPRGWLTEQIRRPPPLADELERLASSEKVLQEFFGQREERKAERKTRKKEPAPDAAGVVGSIRKTLLPHYLAQAEARARMAIRSAASFHERLVQFWTNHFAVSVDKPICLGLAGTLENEAVRPNVTRRFIDLLRAVEKHPAMIAYLDNQYSVGPNSSLARTAARRRAAAGRKIDINENLAREILELHTLGVNGGYTQADVTTFAKVITGWSIGGGQGPLAGGVPGRFHFRENVHEPGAQTLLGKTYRQEGIAQGEAVLADLAAHASTARFLASKLVRHFVADDPPGACVDRVAEAYRKSEGDLPTMYRALIACDAAWTSAGSKYKTPQDFAYSAYRGLAVEPKEQRTLLTPFELLGQRPYSPGSPAGWPDTSRDWDGADALMKRVEWTVALAGRVASTHAPQSAAQDMLGPLATEQLLDSLNRAASSAQGLSILLLSPQFLRR